MKDQSIWAEFLLCQSWNLTYYIIILKKLGLFSYLLHSQNESSQVFFQSHGQSEKFTCYLKFKLEGTFDDYMWGTVGNTTMSKALSWYSVAYTLIRKKEPLFIIKFQFLKSIQINMKENVIIMINIKQSTWELQMERLFYRWNAEAHKGVEILNWIWSKWLDLT